MKRAVVHAVSELQGMYPPAPAEPFVRMVLGLLIGTVVLGLLFYLLERLFPEQPGQRALRTGIKVDAIYWFFDFFIVRRLVTAVTVLALIGVVALNTPRTTLLARQPLWLQAPEALLVADFCGYWSHRIMHQVPMLWRLHKVHHSSEQLDWLAAARVHPLETVWNRLASLLPLFLLGFSGKITGVFGPLLAVYPIFIHCNVRWGYGWIGYVVASPAFHRWHHSADREALNKNFSGLLPLFDFVFGTAHFPKDGKPLRYGLGEEQAPATFWGQLRWPFRAGRLAYDRGHGRHPETPVGLRAGVRVRAGSAREEV